ncbi:HU family DNA-binding protein [Erysipelothrix sp. HDW6C]|uniref:HU family DNA-binding protein n=1 Tax=Erysipelothrix sp. HDW6C TaxID=2714930 RepID=UPI0014074353|nr:HU family DNA-binding protein [Erysipelothrix sp. HDW6C]QIK70145.1 HU family DNA-binding protein [Erysipelothrix sp. HDW6C]
MSETYNKKLLGEAVASKLDISKKQANEFIDAFLEEVKGILEEKGTVDLAGFGKFEVRFRAARDGFNPQTKEKMPIAASYSVGFKPAKALKDAVK